MHRAPRLALGALTLLLASCATPPAKLPAPAPSHPTRPAEPAKPPPAASTHHGLTLAAVGDIMPGTDFPENILPDDDGLSFFDAVTPLLSAPDVTFGNFEGVLLDGGQPVKQCKSKTSCFLFRTPRATRAISSSRASTS